MNEANYDLSGNFGVCLRMFVYVMSQHNFRIFIRFGSLHYIVGWLPTTRYLQQLNRALDATFEVFVVEKFFFYNT